MNATSITLSSAISDAESVRQIAERLANAPTENGTDGCNADELSRNQLFGQYIYEYCMDGDEPISVTGFAKFSADTSEGFPAYLAKNFPAFAGLVGKRDFPAYLAKTLIEYAYVARDELKNDLNDWVRRNAQHGEYPLSSTEISQLDDSVAVEHAIKIATQEYNPDAYEGPDVPECYELSAAQSLSRVAEIIGEAVGQPENEYTFSANELLGQYAYETRMASSNDYPLTEENWAEFKNADGRQSLVAYLENQLEADVEVALEMLEREGLDPASFNVHVALAHAVSLAHCNWSV